MNAGQEVPSLLNIQTSLQTRNLYRRIHSTLADVYLRLGDEDKAKAELELAAEMERSTPDDEFSTTMRNKLAGGWDNLFR